MSLENHEGMLRDLLEKSAAKIAELKAKLAQHDTEKTEPIAIIGMACRFPGGANGPDSYWDLLSKGSDAVKLIPAERWEEPSPDPPRREIAWAGMLDTVDCFEPAFFGISPREAVAMDPQQRLLLEVAWEAIEDAAIDPRSLMGSSTGVFVGIADNDYLQKALALPTEEMDIYHVTGTLDSVAAGRISYTLGLQGPAMVVDTACSSSLVAVHLACKSLLRSESDLALAGGVQLLLSRTNMELSSRTQAYSPDGRCWTFDARANGYVRGEGCGIVALKRLTDAKRDGDRILAIVRGSAVNHDGRSTGLTTPNILSQQALLRKALADAGVTADQVSLVEAHGTGTPLGDPIELEALHAVLGTRKNGAPECAVGSVKTNIGHLEAAAGIAGLMKAVLAMQHRTVPPHCNFRTLNPMISLNGSRLFIPQQATAWAPENHPRIAGVSSFGLSGTNAHVVLEEATEQPERKGAIQRPRHLLPLSARCREALMASARRLADHMTTHPEHALADICFTASTGRSHLEHRAALSATSLHELQEALVRLAETGLLPDDKPTVTVEEIQPPNVAFLYAGQGSQYPGMAREIYRSHPTFRSALDRCDTALRPMLGQSLLDLLLPDDEQDALIHRSTFAQPATFALQYALTELWRSWGITPDVVTGHSLGEYAAACVAGVFSFEEGLMLTVQRGRLAQASAQTGAMASVRAEAARVERAIAGLEDKVAIAAYNGPESIVLSGERQTVMDVCRRLESEGVTTKRLGIDHSSHSPLVEPILDEYEDIVSQVKLKRPRIPLVSNLTGALVGEEVTSAHYWREHMRQPVRFAAGMQSLHKQGADIFVEIGPDSTLLGMGITCLPDENAGWLPSLRHGKDDWAVLLDSLGKLYMRGAQVDWRAFEEPFAARKVSIPGYPFQRQRCWLKSDISTVQRPSSPSSRPDSVLHLIAEADPTVAAEQLSEAAHLSATAQAGLPEVLQALRDYHLQKERESKVSRWLYMPAWEPARHQPQAAADVRGRWLVLVNDDDADEEEAGKALVSALTSAGADCTIIHAASSSSSLTERSDRIDASRRDEVERMVAQAVSEGDELRGVVCLWGWEERPFDVQHEHGHLLPAGLVHILHLLQALASQPSETPISCWFLTRGAASLSQEEPPHSPHQAMLWGFCRAVSLEYPSLWGGMIDLPPSLSGFQLEKLIPWISGQYGEDHVAFRDAAAYVLRLTRYHIPQPAPRPWKPRGTVLITGGLGNLGMHLARWFAAQGIPRLVLTSRRGMDAPGAQQAKEELEQAGTKVTIAQANVADKMQMSRVLAEVQKEGPPLAVVMHLAATIEPRTLPELDPAHFYRTLEAKVRGAEVLDELLQDVELDAFVCYSSTSALWGAATLSSYAAANAHLDAWARARRARATNTVSINWGLWSGGSFLAEEYHRSLQEHGLNAVSAQDALAGLRLVLSQDVPQLAVADVDWERFRASYEARKRRPLLLGLETGSETEEAAQEGRPEPASEQSGPSLLQRLQEAPATERHALLNEAIQARAARILGLPSSSDIGLNRPFRDFGMDSLTGVELRNAISEMVERKLPPSLVFEFPTVREVSAHLLEEHLDLSEADGDAGGMQAVEPGDQSTPNNVSDEELLARMQKLTEAMEELRSAGTFQRLSKSVERRKAPRVRLPLVSIRRSGSRPPLFVAHPGGGRTDEARRLAEHLSEDVPVYGLQARGWEDGETHRASIEDAVQEYVEVIREAYPEGPYWITGYSMGVLIAFEIAYQLEQLGEQVEACLLIECLPAPDPFPMQARGVTELVKVIFDIVFGLDMTQEEQEKLNNAPDLIEYASDRLVKEGMLPPALGVTFMRRFVTMFGVTISQLGAYAMRGKRIHCPTSLIRVEDIYWYKRVGYTEPYLREVDREADWGWSKYASGDVRVRYAPGNHISIMDVDHIAQTGAIVQKELDRYWERIKSKRRTE